LTYSILLHLQPVAQSHLPRPRLLRLLHVQLPSRCARKPQHGPFHLYPHRRLNRHIGTVARRQNHISEVTTQKPIKASLQLLVCFPTSTLLQ
jgi:hypothetical protein